MQMLDSESIREIYNLMDKFNSSNLFELEILIPVPEPQPQYVKIKMLKLARDDKSDETQSKIGVTVENSDGTKENLVK